MAFRTGRCTNDLFCSFASSQQDLQVPAGGNFVCPQCGKALSDPPASTGRSGVRLAIVAGGSLAMGGAMLFVAGIFLGDKSTGPAAAATELEVAAKPAVPPAPVSTAAPAAAHDAGAAPAAPPPGDGASPSAPDASQAATAAPGAPPPAARAPTSVAMAAPAPAPASAPASSQASAPASAKSEAVAGVNAAPEPHVVAAQGLGGPATVQLAMVEQPRPALAPPQLSQPDAAEQARRAQAADLAKRNQAQAEQARKAQAEAQAQAQAQAQAGQARKSQAEQARKEQLLAGQAKKEKALAEAKRERQQALDQARQADEERATREAAAERAAQEQAAREQAARDQAAREQAAKPAPPVVVAAIKPPAPKPAPVPSGPSRAFSTSPVAGGSPPYPAELESDGRSGSVTVACRILEDGHPSGCHVLSARGGEPFKGAVLRWLDSGRVRYQPILHNGKPVAETHQWSVQFQPE